jgi:TolB-like protein/tetratricopeptide (TPR) repeat protein
MVPPVTEPSHAVFLSYASQDAEAAQRICEALRAAGIEVWFDQSALRGGDVWDQTIRKQIKTCALFIAVISRHTHERDEGYFRLEWKLAVDRCHLMAADRAFLLPVVIDDTRDDDERVPERFREVQWTQLPGGVAPATFVERVRRLMSGELSQEPTGTASEAVRVSAAPTTRKPLQVSWRSKAALLAMIAVVVVALGYLVANRLVLSKRGAEVGAVPGSAAQSAPSTAFNPPPHSIAVLPFVNLSGDASQDYFSDGLTEELLNSLADIDGLQVAARTSSFSFKEHPDIATVAHKLNVAAVLEGSVRRSANTIRITAQLINAVTGFHLWSKTYDRDLGDVLKLQTEIATAVASALKVTLLGDVAAKVELGGTRNPAAFDAYLRGAKAYSSFRDAKDLSAAIAAYTEAIRLDPHYAVAFAARSIALSIYAGYEEHVLAAIREGFAKAQADPHQALELAPELAEAHLALASVAENGALDFRKASESYERALALAPGSARVLRQSGYFAVSMGHFDTGLAALRRAVVLDPLALDSHSFLAQGLLLARRYEEAVAAFTDLISLAPDFTGGYAVRGFAYWGLGDLERARASCEVKPDYSTSQQCLAMIYEKLGRHTDAQAELAKLKAQDGDADAYQYAEIYAQWGNLPKALEWLETALRLRDPGLVSLKTDPLMDPLRKEARFQAIVRELKFPN